MMRIRDEPAGLRHAPLVYFQSIIRVRVARHLHLTLMQTDYIYALLRRVTPSLVTPQREMLFLLALLPVPRCPWGRWINSPVSHKYEYVDRDRCEGRFLLQLPTVLLRSPICASEITSLINISYSILMWSFDSPVPDYSKVFLSVILRHWMVSHDDRRNSLS